MTKADAMPGRPIETLTVGDADELTREALAEDVAAFLRIVGDHNPVHSDATFMRETIFAEPIVPGMWTAALISSVIGTRLPGPGAIYASQALTFLRPVKIGDRVTARVKVVEVLPERNRVRLQTTCANQRGELVLAGEAWVLPPKQAT